MSDQILKILKQSFPKRNITLPAGIAFSLEENRVTMTMLDPTACGLNTDGENAKNMQDDSAVFEGWVAILYTHVLHSNGEVLFSIPKKFRPLIMRAPIPGNGHFGRFAYRLLRFAEQYSDWFILDSTAIQVVRRMEYFLGDQSHIFVNNVTDREPGIKCSLESRVEAALASDNQEVIRLRSLLGITDASAPIYRQLPVGLFLNEAHTPLALFPGKGSAVDLWTIDGNTLYPIELKAASAMVGAVTEIFFYSNYLYDMFVAPVSNFRFNPNPHARGYSYLIEKADSLNRVVGILLLDQASLHPLVTEAVLNTLSHPKGPDISYRLVQYELPSM